MRMYRSRNKRVRREKEPFSKITYIDENGYYRWKDTQRLVHRDIAYKQIYLKNRDKYPLPFRCYQIHHIDRNKTNNRVDNLEILTEEEHRKVHGIEEDEPVIWEEFKSEMILLFFFFRFNYINIYFLASL